MDRQQWLGEKRRNAVTRYDTIFALGYDAHWGRINASHRRFVLALVDRCPPGATVLDAACGTGKYWGLLAERSLRVLGIDQSRRMLEIARAKYPWAETMLASLQDFEVGRAFPAVMCVDALENVPPEQWAAVLGRLKRAMTDEARLYFTVEPLPADERERAFRFGRAVGEPVVRGEDTRNGGYHYHPSEDEVAAYLRQVGLKVISREYGDDYWHYLCAKE